jgi:hypothetical protein
MSSFIINGSRYKINCSFAAEIISWYKSQIRWSFHKNVIEINCCYRSRRFRTFDTRYRNYVFWWIFSNMTSNSLNATYDPLISVNLEPLPLLTALKAPHIVDLAMPWTSNLLDSAMEILTIFRPDAWKMNNLPSYLRWLEAAMSASVPAT